MEEAEAVLVERRDHVSIITINRPEARNAVNGAVNKGIGRALAAADADPDIWVVIITGAGDKSFCAGVDLKAVSRGDALGSDDPAEMAWGFAGFTNHHMSKPVIAAVNGFALGGGTEIVLQSDLVVAAETAAFGLPEVKRGVWAGAGGAIRAIAQIPRKLAMEMLLTGDAIDAATAKEWGLVNKVVPLAQLMDAALELAGRITVNAPLSVQASKRIALGIVDGKIASEEDGWARTRAEGSKLMQSEDFREGPRAFAEKRAPQWKAR